MINKFNLACVCTGVVVAFQANQLPNPLVEVSVPGHTTYQAATKHTLKPHFQTAEPARFSRLTADAELTVRLYDDKAGRKKQLLGEARLSARHLQVSCPCPHVMAVDAQCSFAFVKTVLC